MDEAARATLGALAWATEGMAQVTARLAAGNVDQEELHAAKLQADRLSNVLGSCTYQDGLLTVALLLAEIAAECDEACDEEEDEDDD
jgi:hypothetical protein